MEQDSAIEWVDVVDENNDVIGRRPASRCGRKTCVTGQPTSLCMTAWEKFLSSAGLSTKTTARSAGCHCRRRGAAGRADARFCPREAEEELRIAGVPFAEHGLFYYEEPVCRVWGGLFSCVTHGPFALQESEVSEVTADPAEITARCDEFTADSLKALSLWLTRIIRIIPRQSGRSRLQRLKLK